MLPKFLLPYYKFHRHVNNSIFKLTTGWSIHRLSTNLLQPRFKYDRTLKNMAHYPKTMKAID